MEGILHAYEKKSLLDASLKAFEELLVLRHQRPRTLEEYGRRVALLAEHYGRDPVEFNEQEVRDYLVFLIRDKKLRPASIRQARAAIRLFYERVVKVSGWTVFDEIRTKDTRPLPHVLSRAEVGAVLGQLKVQRFIVVLRLIYACGLRLGEAVALEWRDLDAAQGRLRVRDGKGGSRGDWREPRQTSRSEARRVPPP